MATDTLTDTLKKNGAAHTPSNGAHATSTSAAHATSNGDSNGATHIEKKAIVLENAPRDGKSKVIEETKVVEKKGPIKRALPFVFLAILIVGAFYGWKIIQFNQVHESTDDAQIDADISPIIARVGGYVTSVNVKENDPVDSNTLLVTLDAQDLGIKIQNAQAAIANAEAAVRSAEAAATASRANIATAEVAVHKTQTDLIRDQGLLKGNAITQQQFDVTRAAAEQAQAQYAAVQQQASATETQVAVAEAQVAQRKTDLTNAQLQLSYATITSPVKGTVAKKNVEVGQYIQPGQPLMAVTQSDIWITANFKETQIEDIKPGQPVEIVADAYPDVTFHGTVQSISPATGAKFALLPPDNASGNFVKVTQRIPVKVLLTRGENPKTPLRPGMSVDVTVATGK